MVDQEAWVDIVQDPLGMTAFALFLVFLILSRTKISNERRWLIPIFVSMALLTLLGGLTLAVMNSVDPAAENDRDLNVAVEAHGFGAIAIGINNGDVDINNDTPAMKD